MDFAHVSGLATQEGTEVVNGSFHLGAAEPSPLIPIRM